MIQALLRGLPFRPCDEVRDSVENRCRRAAWVRRPNMPHTADSDQRRIALLPTPDVCAIATAGDLPIAATLRTEARPEQTFALTLISPRGLKSKVAPL